jgi:hypothetical protein
MTPEVKAELAELRAKVRELSADLRDEQREHASAVDPSELVQGDETAHIDCIVEFHWQSTIDAGEEHKRHRRAQWSATPTWNRVFKHLGPELMDEASEDYLMERLSPLCLEVSCEELLKEGAAPEEVGKIYDATATIEGFNVVKVQFAALGLIEQGTKRRPPSDTRRYWRLTKPGSEQLLRLRAIRKLTVTDPEPVERSA